MTEVWSLAAIWIALVLIAVLLAIKLRISTALSEIVVGTVAQLIIGAAVVWRLPQSSTRSSWQFGDSDTWIQDSVLGLMESTDEARKTRRTSEDTSHLY